MSDYVPDPRRPFDTPQMLQLRGQQRRFLETIPSSVLGGIDLSFEEMPAVIAASSPRAELSLRFFAERLSASIEGIDGLFQQHLIDTERHLFRWMIARCPDHPSPFHEAYRVASATADVDLRTVSDAWPQFVGLVRAMVVADELSDDGYVPGYRLAGFR